MILINPTPVRKFLLPGILALGAPVAVLHGQGEDEWYDPTDWFDGNNVEADYTYGTEPYDNYNAYYDRYGYDWNDYNAWGYDTWDDDFYNSSYWDEYDWYDNDDDDYLIPDVVYDFDLYYGADDIFDDSDLSRLSGRIEGVSEVRLERASGATGNHRIAKVKLENGQSTVVNLGRAWRTDYLDLAKGDKVEALGQRGMVDDETVFVAHRLRVDGRTIDANPAIRLTGFRTAAPGSDRPSSASSKGRHRPSSSADQQAELTGTVESFNRTTIVGNEDGRAHTFINVELENGRSSIVDLGPNASLASIDLQSGDRIEVRGHRRQRGDRQVVVADLLRINDRSVDSVSEQQS